MELILLYYVVQKKKADDCQNFYYVYKDLDALENRRGLLPERRLPFLYLLHLLFYRCSDAFNLHTVTPHHQHQPRFQLQ